MPKPCPLPFFLLLLPPLTQCLRKYLSAILVELEKTPQREV